MGKQIKNKDTLKLNSGKYLTRANYFNLGSWKEQSQNQLKESFGSNNNIANSIGNIGGGLTTIIDSGVKNAQVADTSNIRNSINTFANTPIESSSREALSNQWINTQLLKDSYNSDEFRTSDRERVANTFNSVNSGATTGLQVGGPWGAVIGGVVGLGSSIAGMVSGNIKARKEARRINELATRENINRASNNYYMSNYLDDYDAYNFRRLSALGGYLGQTHGSNWSNNVTFINEGGLHSENPYDGVQVGVDENGVPDLVEEGEVIFNDYVFSNRLSPTKEQLTEALLSNKYADHTFAWIANELSRESEERANDAISINGLNDSMNKLIQLHELVRQENEIQESNKFGIGGHIAKVLKYDESNEGGTDIDYDAINEDYFNEYLTNKIDLEYLSDMYFSAQDKAYKEASKGKYNLVIGSTAWMNKYKEIFIEELDKLYDKAIKIERQEQANQYREDMGYKKMPSNETGWSYGTYKNKREKQLYMTDEDYKIYQDILNGRNTYIDGNLGKPYVIKQTFEDHTPQELRDAYNNAQNISDDDKSNQYGQRSSNSYSSNSIYSQQRQQKRSVDPNDMSNVPVPEIPDIPIITDEEIAAMNEKVNAQTLRDLERQEALERFNDPNWNRIKQEYDSRVRVDKLPLPEKEKFDYETILKYTPILGNAISLIGNRKDYSDANAFMDQTVNPRSVQFTPLGNYIRPEYIAPWELTNPIERQTSATRSAIMNNSGNNRAAANAALIGSDYNTLGLLGQAYLQGKQYNNSQRLQVAEFNRGTDQYNSQGSLQAQTANMSLNDYYLNRALQEYNMRNLIDMSYNQARSANSTALTQNLFNLYKDKYVRNQANANRYLRYADNGDGTSSRK